MTNGYIVCDLGGTSITTTGVTIAGIYDLLEGATKPVLFTGINLAGTEYSPKYCKYNTTNSKFYIDFGVAVNSTTGVTQTTVEVSSADVCKLITTTYVVASE